MEASLAFSSNTNSKLLFQAKYPGAYGNNINIAVANPADFATGTAEVAPGIALNELFEYFPVAGEVALVVFYQDEIVETFLVSLDPDSKDYTGKSNYIESVVNRKSGYINVKDNTSVTGQPASKINTTLVELSLGASGAPGKDEVVIAYDLHFGNKEEIDIDIVIANELAHAEVVDFCVKRADVIGIVGAKFEDVVGLKAEKAVANLVTYVNSGELNKSTSYATFIGNYKYMYDKYSDKYRWVNIAADIAGLRAKVSNDLNPWFASAGLNQGQLLGTVKLAFNPNNGQRDLMYKNNINPVVSFPGSGVVLWGQKTLSRKPSAFDRVNVRMLFNYMERAIAKMSKYVLFEQNDATTRNLFISTVKPFFERAQAGRGLEAFVAVCDESNNTAIVRQNNQFIADFYIKPTYVAEFITLNFVAVGASISFSEVVGKV